MADEQDNTTERQHDATDRRRESFAAAGDVAKSRELSGAMVLGAAMLMLVWGVVPAMGLLAANIHGTLLHVADGPRWGTSALAFWQTAGIFGAVCALTAVLAGWLQQRGAFSFRGIEFNLDRIDPWPRLGEMLAPKSGLLQVGLASVKVAAVAVVVGAALVHLLPGLLTHVPTGLRPLMATLGEVFTTVMGRGLLCLLVLGALDYFVSYRRLEEKMRMTTQELRDEVKQDSGDGRMRSLRRRKHQQLMKNRSLSDVPRADVVMVNPTHYAVALMYKAENMRAPVVVAKGADAFAERVRALARKHGVPVVSQPALTRALHKQVAVGKPIPPELYQAVALVLAHVYRIRRSAA